MATYHWPLDPALARAPDETRIARALYATPLRTDASGRVVPGLCTAWRASGGFRVWTFTCAHARAIAGSLRRVAMLRASPGRWLFAGASSIRAPSDRSLVVRLPFAWRRFPYALTAIAAAPRSAPGPFHLVRGSGSAVELRDGGTRLVFRRLGRLATLRAIRRGDVDEAPIPLGDVGDFRSSPALHVRRLLAVDALTFRPDAMPRSIRRAYADTANRGDYQALVAEDEAAAAYGLVGHSNSLDPAAFRHALSTIRSLPLRRVRIAVPADATLQYGVRLLLAQWREVGLGPTLVPAGAPADAAFVRDAALYPQDEALLRPLGLDAALGADDQRPAFDRLDAQLRASASVVPISWVADARWVSPRLHGWREDVLGDVDYTRVRLGT